MAAFLTAAGLVLAYQLAGTLLYVFAGILLAVLLDAGTLGLRRLIPVGRLTRLAIVTSVLLVALAAATLWGGMRLVSEARNLFDIATRQAGVLLERLEGLGISLRSGEDGEARSLTDYLPDAAQLFGHAQSTLSAVSGLLTTSIIILFLGIFFAADPISYRDGFLKLLPVEKRRRVGQALVDAGHALRWWLVGQLATMVLVAISVAIMLYLVGIPNAVLLGLVAGLLNFIPFLGPILAGIPIFLASMSEGGSTVLLVMSLFVVLQSLEGYLINPLIQKRAVYVAPAWSLTALVAFGVLFGGMGIALATPILAVTRILVLKLYVEDVLERPGGKLPGDLHCGVVDPPGAERSAR